MPMGTRYNFTYIHARKEVVGFIQIGAQPPVEIVMGAEAFLQDITFISNDNGLKRLLQVIKERKDLPVDHDFGAGGGGFDMKQWDQRMEDKP